MSDSTATPTPTTEDARMQARTANSATAPNKQHSYESQSKTENLKEAPMPMEDEAASDPSAAAPPEGETASSSAASKKRKKASQAERIATDLSRLTWKQAQKSKVSFENGGAVFHDPRVAAVSMQGACTWTKDGVCPEPAYCHRAGFRFESSLPDRNYLIRYSVSCAGCRPGGEGAFHLYCGYCDEILTGSIAGPGGKISDHVVTIRHVVKEAAAQLRFLESRKGRLDAADLQKAKSYVSKLEDWSSNIRFRKSSEEKMEFDAVFAALRAIADGEPIELSVPMPPRAAPAPPATPQPPAAVAAHSADADADTADAVHGTPAPTPSAPQTTAAAPAETDAPPGGTAPPSGDGGGGTGRLLPGLADIGAAWAVGGGGAGRPLGWSPTSGPRGGSLFPFAGGGGGGGGGGVGGFPGSDRWAPPSTDGGAGFFGGALRDGGAGGGVGIGLASPAGQQDLGSILGRGLGGSASAFERRGGSGDGRGGVNGEARGGACGAGEGYASAQTSRQQQRPWDEDSRSSEAAGGGCGGDDGGGGGIGGRGGDSHLTPHWLATAAARLGWPAAAAAATAILMPPSQLLPLGRSPVVRDWEQGGAPPAPAPAPAGGVAAGREAGAGSGRREAELRKTAERLLGWESELIRREARLAEREAAVRSQEAHIAASAAAATVPLSLRIEALLERGPAAARSSGRGSNDGAGMCGNGEGAGGAEGLCLVGSPSEGGARGVPALSRERERVLREVAAAAERYGVQPPRRFPGRPAGFGTYRRPPSPLAFNVANCSRGGGGGGRGGGGGGDDNDDSAVDGEPPERPK